MKNIITERIATVGLLTILSVIIIFHLLIIVGVIPFDIVWGGRLEDSEQMLQFETISILLNAIMLLVVSTRAGIIRWNIKPLLITIALWGMFGLFSVNTIGNLLSNNSLETIIFTPLTLLLALFSWRLAVSKIRVPVL